MESKFIKILGYVATCTSLGMYVSYIPQILNNLIGQKSDHIQPFVAAINCSLWVIYGIKKKDWPLAIANSPGIVFGLFACYTALI
ncbi:SemiSWEET family transporter [Chishuiella sp.]|uniref:SemiSWEET family transporter n=1 Tax=Chishuiella sp. TaxID=1969467 RepID=UPI0028B1E8E3|nr:SemiSWEET family transporter [Chishuiella sp.]